MVHLGRPVLNLAKLGTGPCQNRPFCCKWRRSAALGARIYFAMQAGNIASGSRPDSNHWPACVLVHVAYLKKYPSFAAENKVVEGF